MCFKIEAKGVTPIPPPMRTATSDLKTSSAGAEKHEAKENESDQFDLSSARFEDSSKLDSPPKGPEVRGKRGGSSQFSFGSR